MSTRIAAGSRSGQQATAPSVAPADRSYRDLTDGVASLDKGMAAQRSVHQAVRGDWPDLVALMLGLAAVCVYAKWLLLPFPVSTAGEFIRYLLRLAIVASPDVGFVAAFGAICCAISYGLARFGRAHAFWLPARSTLFAVAALYALVSVGIYKLIMLPATVRLLAIIGNPITMASSIAEHMRPGVMAGLLVAPCVVLLSPVLTRRLWWFRAGAKIAPPLLVIIVAMAISYPAICHVYIRSSWTDPNRWERRIARSPHSVMLVSCAERMLHGNTLAASFDAGKLDESDFRRSDDREFHRPSAAAASIPERPRNAIVIVLESVGAEYLGIYGSPHATTPRLERLAKERGVVFENAYVQAANSCKSLLALSAGVYPRPDWLLTVRDCDRFDVPTIAEVLSERDYRTAYLHSGTWSWKQRDRFLRGRGIDDLIDEGTLAGPRVSSWGVSDRSMFQAALDWIDGEPERPFFMFAYTIETHHPYAAPSPPHDFGVDDPELNRYLNAIRAADETIAWFVEELNRRGLDRSTAIVITSDHGESFGQNGQRLHNFGVYEPSVHIPLVLLHEGVRQAAVSPRDDVIRRHVDVPRTILEVLDVPVPDPWQGHSLLDTTEPRPAYFMATGNQLVFGMRDGDLKYHYYVDSRREELYDLRADPGELLDLAPRNRDRCLEFRRRIGGFVQYQRRFLSAHGAR